VKSNIPASAAFKIPVIHRTHCHFTALVIHAESLTKINKNMLKWPYSYLSLFLPSYTYSWLASPWIVTSSRWTVIFRRNILPQSTPRKEAAFPSAMMVSRYKTMYESNDAEDHVRTHTVVENCILTLA